MSNRVLTQPGRAPTALATSTVVCAPPTTPTLTRAPRTSWSPPRWADGAGHQRGADPAGQFEGLRRPPEWGTDLASQVEGLRKQDSRVEAITPGRRFPSRNGNPLRTPDLTGQQERLVELGISPERIYLDHGLTGTSRLRLVPRSLPAPPAQ
jgi:hypothetical protein